MKLKLSILALLALLIAGCNREPLPVPLEEGGKIVTISVYISPETRVAYDDANRTLSWESGDQLLLAGYDADGLYMNQTSLFTYNTGTVNSFNGQQIIGAATYKAYYPATVTLDANGSVQPLPDAFWQQTQTGDGTTGHLKNKLLLFDEVANSIDQAFNLELKNSILKFNLSNIPQKVGELDQLIYTVETSSGVFKSMTLNVTGITFSSTVNSMTAFLAFDPAVVKIAANGKAKILLIGVLPYVWRSGKVTGGKNYLKGNRYTDTVSSGWTLDNPLIYVAESNVNPAGNGFVANPTACQGCGYFDFNAAKAIDIPGHHLPDLVEWSGIVPKYVTNQNYYVRFNSPYSYVGITENVTVQGENVSMTSDFRTTSNRVSYALRYKGTHMVSAWKYEYVYDTNKEHTHLKITSRNVAPSVTIGDIDDGTFWTSGTGNDVVRYFPAGGYYNNGSPNNVGVQGYYRSSTVYSTAGAWNMYFNSTYAISYYGNIQTNEFTVRLFVPGN